MLVHVRPFCAMASAVPTAKLNSATAIITAFLIYAYSFFLIHGSSPDALPAGLNWQSHWYQTLKRAVSTTISPVTSASSGLPVSPW